MVPLIRWTSAQYWRLLSLVSPWSKKLFWGVNILFSEIPYNQYEIIYRIVPFAGFMAEWKYSLLSDCGEIKIGLYFFRVIHVANWMTIIFDINRNESILSRSCVLMLHYSCNIRILPTYLFYQSTSFNQLIKSNDDLVEKQ